MARRVVRVQIPHVYEYDVVFDDEVPVYIGTVIKREASKKGPNRGKVIDTHRTNWDGRAHQGAVQDLFRFVAPESPGNSGYIAMAALEALHSRDPTSDPVLPAAVSRPYKRVIKGRR